MTKKSKHEFWHKVTQGFKAARTARHQQLAGGVGRKASPAQLDKMNAAKSRTTK